MRRVVASFTSILYFFYFSISNTLDRTDIMIFKKLERISCRGNRGDFADYRQFCAYHR